jgi:hypothetical protein
MEIFELKTARLDEMLMFIFVVMDCFLTVAIVLLMLFTFRGNSRAVGAIRVFPNSISQGEANKKDVDYGANCNKPTMEPVPCVVVVKNYSINAYKKQFVFKVPRRIFFDYF